jgi:hypothetical protein
MPVKDEVFEKRPAKEHHNPVPVKRRAFAGGRNVVKGPDPVSEPAPDRLQAVAQDQERFAQSHFPDVFHVMGVTAVDVITFNRLSEGGRKPLLLPGVAAEPVEHQFHHVTLAMVRRRGVGEDKKFH